MVKITGNQKDGNLIMNHKEMLVLLNEKICKCEKCPELVANRTQTVLDSGNPDAKILMLAEAPGEDEDKQGEVLIGRAGQLLTNIIKACGWDRTKDIYLCNILKCRPPSNRKPTLEEASNCDPFLKLQLKIVNPKIIICLGATAANNLLKTDTSIGQLRGRWFKYENADVICTYHPSYALRQSSAKMNIYDDFQLVIEKIKSL